LQALLDLLLPIFAALQVCKAISKQFEFILNFLLAILQALFGNQQRLEANQQGDGGAELAWNNRKKKGEKAGNYRTLVSFSRMTTILHLDFHHKGIRTSYVFGAILS